MCWPFIDDEEILYMYHCFNPALVQALEDMAVKYNDPTLATRNLSAVEDKGIKINQTAVSMSDSCIRGLL